MTRESELANWIRNKMVLKRESQIFGQAIWRISNGDVANGDVSMRQARKFGNELGKFEIPKFIRLNFGRR